MQTIISRIGKRTFLLAAMLAVVSFSASAQVSKVDTGRSAASPLAEIPSIFGSRIAGIWDAEVSITNCANGATILSFQALGLFGLDGTFLDTNSQNPTLKSSTFGYWKHVTGNRYKFASKFFRFAPDGTYVGTTVIRHNVELAPDGQNYVSSGTGAMYDTSGVKFFEGCSSAVAIRFK